MNYRQVHLDFHTSEKISEIGELFDKEQFQAALKAGHVDSVTLFSKCHHGWAYHPSIVNDMHPELKFDLLGAQIEAAHEIGVKTPVYLSAGHDEKYAVVHRDHLVCSKEVADAGGPDCANPGYQLICMNTPYLDILLAQIKEVCENYDADGIFLDIMGVRPCCCKQCQATLLAEGKDPMNPEDVLDLAERVYANYTRKVRETIDSIKPGLPVFHNGGHIRRGRRDIAYANTHLELESLPTGGWGYDHFPVSASYARALGMEFLGMTGKFHFCWGEFGGFKHPNALRYEAALSMANGAKCSVGDQLHPSGQMDMATYQLIGTAYKELEEKERYVKDAKNVTDIAVLGVEAIENYYSAALKRSSKDAESSDAGCARILLEGKYLFDYVDTQSDLTGYKLLILPDKVVLDESLGSKIQAFIKKGGKVLATGTSATDKNGTFLFDFGCKWLGENGYRPDYVRPDFEMEGLLGAAYVMYAQGYRVAVDDAIAVHGSRENPYFNRTREHFCSHRHTPNDPVTGEPASVEGKDGIYIGWNIFEEYADQGCLIAKRIVCAMIDRLLTEPSVKTNLPAQGVITLMKKYVATGDGASEAVGEETAGVDSMIVHILYASPVKRGKGVEVIEDLLPVYDTQVWIKCDRPVRRVYLAPQEQDIPYETENGYIKVNVDHFTCHQMIIVSYTL